MLSCRHELFLGRSAFQAHLWQGWADPGYKLQFKVCRPLGLRFIGVIIGTVKKKMETTIWVLGFKLQGLRFSV